MPTASLQFRAATETDVTAITGLLNQLNQAEGNPTVMHEENVRSGLFGTDRKVPLRALLAIHNEAIIGAVLYYVGYDILTSVNGYHLGDLVVDSAYRRQGVGRALFAALAAQNLEEGGEWISLTALSKNTPALNFYRGLGMVNVAVDFFAAGKIILQDIIHTTPK